MKRNGKKGHKLCEITSNRIVQSMERQTKREYW